MRVSLGYFLQEINEKTTLNDQFPVLTSSKAGLFLQSDYFNKQVASQDNSGYKIIRRGQFTYRAMSDTGAFFPNMLECTDIGIVSPAYPVFEITKPQIIIPSYLKYYFKSNKFQHSIASFAQGSTRTSIKFDKLRTVEIELPDIDSQKTVVDTIESIKHIIDSRHRELSTFDSLIKARFVEMFGDPVINPKGYPILPISDLFEVGSSKRVFESEWRDTGVPFYRAREIVKLFHDGYVNNELFIDEDLYEKYKTKYGVPRVDDMMVTGVGTLGICYIVRPNDRFYFKDGNTLWFKNKGLCNVRFIMEQYSTDFVRNQIEANANVSTVGTYTITNANNTMVLVPPIEEQNQFDTFVNQIDKSKVVV